MKAQSDIIAYRPTAGGATINIHGIEEGIEEYVIYSHTGEKKAHRARIYWNADGMAYFRAYGRREYIHEFMRVWGA